MRRAVTKARAGALRKWIKITQKTFRKITRLIQVKIGFIGFAVIVMFAAAEFACFLAAYMPVRSFTCAITNGAVTITGYTGESENVVIPKRIRGIPVTALGSNLLAGSYHLDSVRIPKYVTQIDDGALVPEFQLQSISVDRENTAFVSQGGVLFTKDMKTLVQCPSAISDSYVIPSGVTKIGNQAFMNSFLHSVTIPDTVTSIGDAAFNHCVYLSGINIPQSVTHIGDFAFQHCFHEGAVSIVIPDGVTSIGERTFFDSYLSSVTIPDSVTSIGALAFVGTGLDTLTIPAGVKSIGDMALETSRTTDDSLSVYFEGDAPAVAEGDVMFAPPRPSITVYYHTGAKGWTNPWQGCQAKTY